MFSISGDLCYEDFQSLEEPCGHMTGDYETSFRSNIKRAFVTSRVDNCNSLLISRPNCSIWVIRKVFASL